MINLIPPTGRRIVKREYWTRVMSVWMLLVATALLMVTLLHLPVYILVKEQLAAFADSFAAAETNVNHFTDAAAEIEKANAVSKLLVTEHRVPFSTIINDITAIATPGIVITSHTMTRTKTEDLSIVISGEAATRQELATFKTNLEAHERFASAELPISNLAKDVEIPFQITIIPAVIETEV